MVMVIGKGLEVMRVRDMVRFRIAFGTGLG